MLICFTFLCSYVYTMLNFYTMLHFYFVTLTLYFLQCNYDLCLISEIIPLYNVSTFMGHEEYCKPPPKKLKQPVERTGISQVTSSLSSSYKNSTACTTTANGYSKSHSSSGGGGGGSPGNKRPDRRARGSPKHTDAEPQG